MITGGADVTYPILGGVITRSRIVRVSRSTAILHRPSKYQRQEAKVSSYCAARPGLGAFGQEQRGREAVVFADVAGVLIHEVA